MSGLPGFIVLTSCFCPQALGVLHDESLSSKAKPHHQKLAAAMCQLVQSVQTPSCPSYSAAALLRALSHVNGQVRRGGNTPAPSSAHNIVLLVFLSLLLKVQTSVYCSAQTFFFVKLDALNSSLQLLWLPAVWSCRP